MRSPTAVLFAIACLQVSCSVGGKSTEAVKHVTFSYEAKAALRSQDIPSFVYVFPPLRSSSDGKPIEKLTPVTSPTGGVSEWKTSSALSMSLKKKIEKDLTMQGYEPISFGTLTAVRKPYAVVVISTFYSLPYDVKNAAGEVTDKATLVLIKGALFEGNLSPATKKDIIKVDGVTKIPEGKELPDPVSRTVAKAYSWFADNSSGFTLMN